MKFVGCGGHSYRNVYPTFQYAPIDLVAVCDFDLEKARAYARQFGAKTAYSDYRDMLTKENLDAVFVVTSYEREDGEPQSTKIVLDVLEAGLHVWIEKPQSGKPDNIREMMALSEQKNRYVFVGYKKAFSPAYVKAKELMDQDDFGSLTSCSVRYPESLPPLEKRRDGSRMRRFLDHYVHPASILYALAGPIHSMRRLRDRRRGATITLIDFVNGAIGAMHLTAGQSGMSPLERVELIGEGSNLVVDNGIYVTYYRPGKRGKYGRTAGFIPDEIDMAPLTWSPEFSLGQLYNKNIFTLGYAQEILYFCDCVLNQSPPEYCNLEMALEMAKIYQGFLCTDDEEIIINPRSPL